MCLLHMEVGTWVRCDQENAKGITEDSGEGEGSPETLPPRTDLGPPEQTRRAAGQEMGLEGSFPELLFVPLRCGSHPGNPAIAQKGCIGPN